MLPPLLRLFMDEPALLASHAGAYTDLLCADAARWRARQLRRLLYLAAAVAALVVALALGGVALMLHAATGSSHWLLWAVPAAPLLGALAAGLACRASPVGESFPRVRRQIAEDMELFGLKDTPP